MHQTASTIASDIGKRGGETITFQGGQEREAVAASAKTTLTAWFSLNAEDPDGQEPQARSLHYAQIPEHFVWNEKEGKWQRRQRMSVANRVIGRLHSANPSEGPRFYLYLLLLHKKGATSFEDLVTITKHNGDRQTFIEQLMDKNGILQDTTKPDYRRAAQELGFCLRRR